MEGQAIHIDTFTVNVSTLVHSSNDLQRGKGRGKGQRAKGKGQRLGVLSGILNWVGLGVRWPKCQNVPSHGPITRPYTWKVEISQGCEMLITLQGRLRHHTFV